MGESKLTMTDGSGYRQALLAPHPFWATLSPVTVKQRIEQLLSAPDSAALVQSLPAIEYAVLLKAAPDMRTVLLQLASPEQIRTVLDLDCWHQDTLQSPRVLEWLEEVQPSGADGFSPAPPKVEREMRIRLFTPDKTVKCPPPPLE